MRAHWVRTDATTGGQPLRGDPEPGFGFGFGVGEADPYTQYSHQTYRGSLSSFQDMGVVGEGRNPDVTSPVENHSLIASDDAENLRILERIRRRLDRGAAG